MSSIKLGILHPCVPARHQRFKGSVGSVVSVMSPSLPHGCNALLNVRLLPSSEFGVRGWGAWEMFGSDSLNNHRDTPNVLNSL